MSDVVSPNPYAFSLVPEDTILSLDFHSEAVMVAQLTQHQAFLCPVCGRLIVWWDGADQPTYYKSEPGAA